MAWSDWLTNSDPAAQRAAEARQADIADGVRRNAVPRCIAARLHDSATGKLPWVATLTPAELRIVRTHGLHPIAAVSATCWMQYNWSWTEGHAQGWNAALHRLRMEARAAGANAVLDVKMRTIPLQVDGSMDFTLVGTAVRLESADPSAHPVVATLPALEFVKLLEADVVPTGIAIGAHYQWMTDWRRSTNQAWMGNIETRALSDLWQSVRHAAHADLRRTTLAQGNGALAHVNFSEMFEQEQGEGQPKKYLARHIVVATVVDARRDGGRSNPIPHDIGMAVDMHAGGTKLTGRPRHHQSYASNDADGAI